MKTMTFQLEPFDTLFFRDARPMEGSAAGRGARWPLPTVLHEALRSALLRAHGSELGPKRLSGHRRNGVRRSIVTRDFESLRLLGPLPMRGSVPYLPTPADLVPDGEGGRTLLAPLDGNPGRTNFPASWLRPVAATARPGKETLPNWLTLDDFTKALRGELRDLALQEPPLWTSERRIGIEIDPERRSVVEGKFYLAEHLRLIGDVTLWIEAGLAEQSPEWDQLRALAGSALLLGGESRSCRIAPSTSHVKPEPPKPTTRIKWVLASPALFLGGWRPNWIDQSTGTVLLKAGETTRRPGEDRLTWRTRIRELPDIDAKLVAVCSDKPIAFSGWDLSLPAAEGKSGMGGPKPTRLAVPAGSVYYFEAGSPEAGAALVRALHGRTQSDLMGEKGLGWGFCGSWSPLTLKAWF